VLTACGKFGARLLKCKFFNRNGYRFHAVTTPKVFPCEAVRKTNEQTKPLTSEKRNIGSIFVRRPLHIL
jgi:hypothetical protein